jgi:hypothetical protein
MSFACCFTIWAANIQQFREKLEEKPKNRNCSACSWQKILIFAVVFNKG